MFKTVKLDLNHGLLLITKLKYILSLGIIPKGGYLLWKKRIQAL